MNKNSIKNNILQDVKKGASLRATAKKYQLPLSTVAYWCNEHDIQTTHTRSPKKASNKDIVKKIKEKQVMTIAEIEEEFGYKKNAARRRLKNMIQTGELNYIVIPGGGGKTSTLFKGYIDTNLYYIYKSDLVKWIKNRFPKKMPRNLKRAISQRFRDSGIDFEFEKIEKKSVVVTENVYNKIKKRAKDKGISISEYLRDAI